jgi:hypothetical protein
MPTSEPMGKSGLFVTLALLFSAQLSAQPGVELTGRITLNGEPAQDRPLAFWSARSSTEVTTRTDIDGRYRVVLPHAGDFMVVVRDWPQTTHVVAQDQKMSFDWAVEGATVTVDLYGNLDAPAKVEFRRRSPDFLTMRSMPPSQTRYVFEGLPFGVFRVRAYNGFAASEDVLIELARNRPQETVTLYLVPK